MKKKKKKAKKEKKEIKENKLHISENAHPVAKLMNDMLNIFVESMDHFYCCNNEKYHDMLEDHNIDFIQSWILGWNDRQRIVEIMIKEQ